MILGGLAGLFAFDADSHTLLVPAADGGVDARVVETGWLRWHADTGDCAVEAGPGRYELVRDGHAVVVDVVTGVALGVGTATSCAVEVPVVASTLGGLDGSVRLAGREVAIVAHPTECAWVATAPAAERGLGACDFAWYAGRDRALVGRGSMWSVVRLADGVEEGRMPALALVAGRWTVLDGTWLGVVGDTLVARDAVTGRESWRTRLRAGSATSTPATTPARPAPSP